MGEVSQYRVTSSSCGKLRTEPRSERGEEGRNTSISGRHNNKRNYIKYNWVGRYTVRYYAIPGTRADCNADEGVTKSPLTLAVKNNKNPMRTAYHEHRIPAYSKGK